LFGLNLLLLLERGLTLSNVLITISQPHPRLRHMCKFDPCIAVAESGGHLKALLCATPILVCPTRHDLSPSVR
jgi:hypothetical protein